MKTLNISLLLIITGVLNVSAQQAFSNVSLDKFKNYNEISFSVPAEANVFEYRVLAGTDTTDLAVLGTIQPSGNSVFARNYRYEIYEPVQAYYRVVSVGMDAKLKYSTVITAKKQETDKVPIINAADNTRRSTLVQSH